MTTEHVHRWARVEDALIHELALYLVGQSPRPCANPHIPPDQDYRPPPAAAAGTSSGTSRPGGNYPFTHRVRLKGGGK